MAAATHQPRIRRWRSKKRGPRIQVPRSGLRKDDSMAHHPLRSDRLSGPADSAKVELQAVTSAGLLALMQSRLEANWVAAEFPEVCPDPEKTHVFSTDSAAFSARVQAVIPGLEWPLWKNRDQVSDVTLFDLVEFMGRYVAEPKEGTNHGFYDHHALTFDRASGAQKFRDDVNELLSRGGSAYTMVGDLTIERIVPVDLSTALSALNPATGDALLDEQIERGRTLFRSRRQDDQLAALQSLWGALEHLKTIELPGQNQKRVSAELLLSQIDPLELRDAVRIDMVAVTDLGNGFRIRHQEAHIPAVPPDAYDYFAGRITNLLLLLLRQTGRLV